MPVLKIYLSICFSAVISSSLAQTADSILNYHIEAMGGLKNWNKVKTLKITGSPAGGSVNFKSTEIVVDGKVMRQDIIFHGQDNFIVATPQEGWSFTVVPYPPGSPIKITPVPADQLKAGLSKLDIKRDLLLDKSAFVKTEFAGIENINNKPCYTLKITEKDGNVETAFFEVATGYLVREVKISTQDGTEKETDMDFSDFLRQPSGIVYPMTIKNAQGEFKISSIEVNLPVDDSLINTQHGTLVPKNENK